MILLDDEQIAARWGAHPTTGNVSVYRSIAHAQARAIISWGNETCIQHKPFPPAKLKKRHECFKCWLQLEAELDSLLSGTEAKPTPLTEAK